MEELTKLAERAIVIVGLLYLTESFYQILPSPILSLIQHGVYLLVFLLLLARSKRSVLAASTEKFVLILLFLCLCSFLWSDLAANSLRSSIIACQTASFGIYFASCYTFKQQIKLLAISLGIAMILSSIYTVLFPQLAIHTDELAGAWRGIYAQRNILAQVASLSVVTFWLLFLIERRYSYIASIGLCLSFALVFLSGSKTGLAVTVMSIFLYPLYKAFRWQDIKIILLLNILLLVVGSSIVLGVNNQAILAENLGRDATLTGRTLIWTATIDKLEYRPWLGYGREVFWNSDSGIPQKIARELGGAENYIPPHAHNGFLDLISDLGLVGLFLFLSSFVITYWRACNRIRYGNSIEDIWPIAYLSFFFLYNLTEGSIMKHNSALWAVYITVALAVNIKYVSSITPVQSEVKS